MPKGLFITFEGIDGCGKSTQVQRVGEALSKAGVPVLITREPGGTAIGEKIRALLLDPANAEMCSPCEVLLYLASRAQHVQEVIAPATARGNVVLCDRFADATIAYQGYGRGIDVETLIRLTDYAAGGLQPDRSFIFDVPVSEAARRLHASGKAPDRLEGSGRSFHESVRAGYLALARRWPERIVVLEGGETPEVLAGRTLAVIRGLMGAG